jgi:hypothetical protein
MPFDWRDHDGQPLQERFRENLGREVWLDLLEVVANIDGLAIDQDTARGHIDLLKAFEKFLAGIDRLTPSTPDEKIEQFHPTVFVSHQRADLVEAERIAFLACQQGVDYWLDIHDPLLRLANRTIPPHDLRYPIIIAAIIEIGLLNSTCLIAVHSLNSLASKWVPYELGRVRDRRIQSANVGGWFHPMVRPGQCGDYVHLCGIAHGDEPLVDSWLQKWAGGNKACKGWPPGRPTRPLPV